MKLLELEPRWIHSNVLAFLCPHCRKDILIVKNVKMSFSDEYEILDKAFGPDWNQLVVPADPDCAWTINGTLENLTVTPSLDASASGHWHGHITNGEIV